MPNIADSIAMFRDRLKSRKVGGAYLFAGEEDYLKKYYLGELVKTASGDPAFDLFNHTVFDGNDADFAAIKEAISSPPMMADYKIVEWKYPEIDRMKENELKALEEIAASAGKHPETVFAVMTATEAFDCGTVKRPSKTAARLSKSFCLLNFEKSTDGQLLSWLKKHFDAAGIAVDAQTLSLLIFRVGHSMTVLSGEVDKLSAYLKQNGKDRLTEADVNEITVTTDEFDGFALSNAITDRNRQKAFAALRDMERRKVDSGMALAMLARSFSDMVSVSLMLDEGGGVSEIETFFRWNPYKVKICISAAKRFGTERLTAALSDLRKADAASKSGGVAGYSVLENFLAKYI